MDAFNKSVLGYEQAGRAISRSRIESYKAKDELLTGILLIDWVDIN
jgi:hypothetical protein